MWLPMAALIGCVAGLAMRAYRYMGGRHSKKSGAFAKACLAYCHITIPSIADVFQRLHLMLFCGQVSHRRHRQGTV
jgi:hypothetical protein